MRSEVKLVLGGKKSCIHSPSSADFGWGTLTVSFSVRLHRFSTGGAGKISFACGTLGAKLNGEVAGETGKAADSLSLSFPETPCAEHLPQKGGISLTGRASHCRPVPFTPR